MRIASLLLDKKIFWQKVLIIKLAKGTPAKHKQATKDICTRKHSMTITT